MTILEAKAKYPQKELLNTNIGIYPAWKLAYFVFNGAIKKIKEESGIRCYSVNPVRYNAIKSILEAYSKTSIISDEKEYTWQEITDIVISLTKK